MSDNYIDAGNGEQIRIVQDDSANGYTMYSSQNGRVVLVDEDALARFDSNARGMSSGMDDARAVVTGGNVNLVVSFGFLGDVPLGSIDAQRPRFGGFDDAEDLKDAYLESYYKAKAEQVERIALALETAREVARAIGDSYLDADGNTAASMDQVGGEFDARTGIDDSDVSDAREENASVDDETAAESESDTRP